MSAFDLSKGQPIKENLAGRPLLSSNMDDTEDPARPSNKPSDAQSSTDTPSSASQNVREIETTHNHKDAGQPLQPSRTGNPPEVDDGSYEYKHQRSDSKGLSRIIHHEGQTQQALRKPLYAVTSRGMFDPITVIALVGGVVGSIFTNVIGLGGFNHVPNFGYLTWYFGQRYPGGVSSCLTVIGNVIAGCLTLPIVQAITVYLRWKVGRGNRLKISSMKLYIAVLGRSLFSQDGLRSWLGSKPTLKAWSLPLTLALTFTNALVVPLLSQDWAPYTPTEFLWAYQTIPTFDEAALKRAMNSYSSVNISTVTDELSPLKLNISIPSYVRAATYTANPEVALYLSGQVQRFSIYSGPGKTSWSGRAPPSIPRPDATILEVENLLTDRLYSNCPDCSDAVTRIESAGLDPQYTCKLVLADGKRTNGSSSAETVRATSKIQAVEGEYGFSLTPANIDQWDVSCNYSITGARWDVYRSRNNATGWYYKVADSSFSILGGSSRASTIAKEVSDAVVAEMRAGLLPDIFRYEDLSTVRGRAVAANAIAKVLISSFTTTFFVLFSSYTLVQPNDKSLFPQSPLGVSVYSGLFGQGSAAALQATLLGIIMLLSLSAGTWLFYMASTGKYVSVCNIIDPVSTLVLDCVDTKRFKISTGDAQAVPERIEGVQLVVDETGERKMVCVVSAPGERGVSKRRRPQPELLYE